MSSNILKLSKITGKEIDFSAYRGENMSFWQSPLWAQILVQTGQAQDIYLCEYRNMSFLIERRSIFSHFTGLFVLGSGENLMNKELVGLIQKEIITKNDLFLQVEPLDYENSNTSEASKKAPFRRFIESRTALLHLSGRTEEDLLASFAEKGRYNIRLAQKRGVATRWVRLSEKIAEKTCIQAFYDLLDETTKRDGFAHNSIKYYQTFVEALEKENAGGLLVAEKDGMIHAAGIFVYWNGVAIYYYGASSSDPEIRRDMATYLLQWDAIREGLRRGCHTYDFLGISPDGKGRLTGVTEFKRKFSPKEINFSPEAVVVFRPGILTILKFLRVLKQLFSK